jgi:hypothetical protein
VQGEQALLPATLNVPYGQAAGRAVPPAQE